MVTVSRQRSSKGKRTGCLGGLAFVATMIALMAANQFVFTRWYAPETHAHADRCIGPYVATPSWENTCDYPVNFRFCLLAGPTREACRTLALAPGEGVGDIGPVQAELGGGLNNMRTKACKAPFVPDRKPHPNNRRLRDVCARP